MHLRKKDLLSKLLGSTLAVTMLGAPSFLILAPSAHAQATAITGNQVTTATVETIDPDTKTILLRDHTGGLVTVTIPKDAHNLPHLQPGDQINLRFFQTIAADIAKPDTPLPESTVSSAKGLVHRHPHGTLISFRRQRVRILAVDATNHTVTFIDPDQITRTTTVHHKPMQALLSTLKVGDEVDVTTMDAVSFEVTNRTITPAVTVSEKTGQQTPVEAPHPQQ
ncbi:preprotein translocase subunit YajC [Kozakia baliensis]|uniref:preprotein translocase subunit YajC n=1 Tax=Kozakia baliensis TaxID=153496 RepID=UPI00345C3766